MADFCFECWNRLNENQCRKKDFVLSKDTDLCEGCGKYKQVIERERCYSGIGFLQKLYNTLTLNHR